MRTRPAKLSLGGAAPGTSTRSSAAAAGSGEEAGEPSATRAAKPYEEVFRSFEQELHRDFEILAKLGSGSTSTVSKALWRAKGTVAAVKVTRSSDSAMIVHAEREYKVLRKLSYPTLPDALYFQAYPERGRAVIAMSYFDGAEMQRAVLSSPCGHLDEPVVRGWARQLMATLDYLHGQGVLHRDIKPQNVIVSDDLKRICLIDFNASHCSSYGEPLTPTGTRLYSAPELLRGGCASAASDVWGAGLCLYFAMSGRLPQGRTPLSADSHRLQQQCEREVTFPRKRWGHASESCMSCLRKSLALEEGQRPGANELLGAEPWLAEGSSS